MFVQDSIYFYPPIYQYHIFILKELLSFSLNRFAQMFVQDSIYFIPISFIIFYSENDGKKKELLSFSLNRFAQMFVQESNSFFTL